MPKNTKTQILSSKPIQPTLRSMKLYDKESFDIRKSSSVKVSANTINIQTGYEFSTKLDRSKNIIEVTRIA